MPQSPLELNLPNEAATEALGRQLARLLRPMSADVFVVYLNGPLGAGKTCLARSLLRELGATGTIRSPTYTLLEIYTLTGITVVHLDLYRLGTPEELEALGLRELLEPGHMWLIEWPERGAGALPPANLCVALKFAGEGRCAIVDADALGAIVLERLKAF